MKPSSAKAKGRRLQQYVRDRIREVFAVWLQPDDVESRSTSAGGEDVPMSPAARACVPFSIESKNVQRLNLWAAWEQAEANAREHEPMLVISRNRSVVLSVVEFDIQLALLRELKELREKVARIQGAQAVLRAPGTLTRAEREALAAAATDLAGG